MALKRAKQKLESIGWKFENKKSYTFEIVRSNHKTITHRVDKTINSSQCKT